MTIGAHFRNFVGSNQNRDRRTVSLLLWRAQKLSKRCHGRDPVETGRCGPRLGLIWQNFGYTFDQHSLIRAISWSTLAKVDPHLAKFDRLCGRRWPNLGKFRGRENRRQHRPNLVDNFSTPGPNRAKLGPHRRILADCGLNLGSRSNFSTAGPATATITQRQFCDHGFALKRRKVRACLPSSAARSRLPRRSCAARATAVPSLHRRSAALPQRILGATW